MCYILKYILQTNAFQPTDMDIYYLHTRTDIAFRFASTQVTSKLANSKDNATEAIFHIKLPEAAFITNFTMYVCFDSTNNKKYAFQYILRQKILHHFENIIFSKINYLIDLCLWNCVPFPL